MTTPTDFSSFAYGFDLTAANYSGGAGGTFTNLVSGGEDWTVNGATPGFTTKSGTGWSLEGMDFSGIAGEAIQGEHRAQYECTVVAICQPTTAASHYLYGGTSAIANTFAAGLNAYRLNTYSSGFVSSSGFTSAFSAGVPHVLACSWSPFNGTLYAQADDGAVVSTQQAVGSYQNAGNLYFNAAIGQHRAAYFTGWISRVLVFSRALHYRGNTALQSLIATEMAKIGL